MIRRTPIYNCLLIAVTFTCFSLSRSMLFAQQDLTMYNMPMIPQHLYTNPAVMPFYRVNIGLPMISSQYLNISHTGFKIAHLIRRDKDDSLYLDMENFLNKLAKKNYLLFSYQPDLLSFGFRVKKNYFSFNATEKVNVRFRYPRQFFEFLWKGNADPDLLDKEINLNFGLYAMHYREYGLGFARELDSKLTVGGKLKYLYGMANVWTKKSDVILTTSDSKNYPITLKADLLIHTSGAEEENIEVSDYLFKKKNKGLGLDLGGVYKFTDKITFSGSILDFGYIRWKDNVANLVSAEGEQSFTFQGLPLEKLLDDTSYTMGDLVQDMQDSIIDAFKFETTYGSYSTWLPAKIYLGGNYAVAEKSNAGVLLFNQFYDRSIHPGLALSFNQRVARWFSASVSYSMYNRSYNNIGLGLSMNGGPLQLYIVTDNILSATLVQVEDAIFPNAKNTHIHFGINFNFGRPSIDKDKDGVPDKEDACPKIPGLKEFSGCPDKDGDRVPDQSDECPDIKGLPEFSGCPDRDGDKLIDKKDSCPDVAGVIDLNGCPDRDNDKIIDMRDSCPDDQGLPEFNGCPDRDNDKIIDKNDLCPDNAGTVELLGCPDRDEDGIADKEDRCPDKAGLKENDGCPKAKLYWIDKLGNIIGEAVVDKEGKFIFKELPIDETVLMKLESYDVLIPNEISVVSGTLVRVARKGADGYFHFELLPAEKNKMQPIETPDVQIQLKAEEARTVKKAMETLEFDFGSDVIRSSSIEGLDQLAELLQQNPAWRLKLSGHTDNVSSMKFNMELSKKRVESIKKYLAGKKSIQADRIVLKWHGPVKPIAPNDTEEGRQKNRRVEFLIIR